MHKCYSFPLNIQGALVDPFSRFVFFFPLHIAGGLWLLTLLPLMILIQYFLSLDVFHLVFLDIHGKFR